MTGPTTVPEVLAAAADYIDEHGWMRGDFCDKQGRVCVRGALYAVVTGSPDPRSLFEPDELVNWATVELDQSVDGLIEVWNDTEGRTARDVTDLLRQLADVAADTDLLRRLADVAADVAADSLAAECAP